MEGTSEAVAVKEALAAGRLTVPDPKTGFHHTMYAVCPQDGAQAVVRRVERGQRGAIIEVVARCPQCGQEVRTTAEELHLR